jgi:hypothetical protein
MPSAPTTTTSTAGWSRHPLAPAVSEL